ncbi:hypothetical protein E4K67_01430 [Desulfosporosinus fructosivorans]|uniref:Uncharacterized protein n=1 Tax=Desulfosporosinus fructosivorans TaxID=2018669 RepID=A0A4Z0RA23_9FIRM|nr:hypothetical protein [Desulfosporosinus fructosivorans]TGE39688.1 hypothetical protein E4K67_01430 [Desulfosporosinus fructosivorans]
MGDIALRHTTQSKLTVKAPTLGSGVPGKFAILGSVAGFARPVLSPVSGVGSFNGSLLFCFRKDIALMSPCVPGWGRRTKNGERRTENGERRDGTFHAHRLMWQGDVSCGKGTFCLPY